MRAPRGADFRVGRAAARRPAVVDAGRARTLRQQRRGALTAAAARPAAVRRPYVSGSMLPPILMRVLMLVVSAATAVTLSCGRPRQAHTTAPYTAEYYP